MKTINILASTLLLGALSMTSLTTLASQNMFEPEYYAGIQLGMGFVDINDENAITSALSSVTGNVTSYSSSTKGFAGRLYGGYIFNDIVSAELGFAKYNNADSSAHSSLAGDTVTTSATNKTTAIDLLAVYSLPVTTDVKIHLKAGFAYVMNRYEIAATVNNGQGGRIDSRETTHKIRPKFAVGADYDLTEFVDNLSVGLSYEITQGSGRPFSSSVSGGDAIIRGNNSYTPMVQMLSLDVKYTF